MKTLPTKEDRKYGITTCFVEMKKTAKCNLCDKILNPGGSSTRSLLYHLQNKHDITVSRRSSTEEEPAAKVVRLEKPISMEEELARLVAIEGMTFNQIATTLLNLLKMMDTHYLKVRTQYGSVF